MSCHEKEGPEAEDSLDRILWEKQKLLFWDDDDMLSFDSHDSS